MWHNASYFVIVNMYIFIVIVFLSAPLIEDQILRYVVYKPHLLLLILKHYFITIRCFLQRALSGVSDSLVH